MSDRVHAAVGPASTVARADVDTPVGFAVMASTVGVVKSYGLWLCGSLFVVCCLLVLLFVYYVYTTIMCIAISISHDK